MWQRLHKTHLRTRMLRLVPSARALLLTAAALVTLTLAAAASVVSISPGGRIAIETEPLIAWIAVAGVLVLFAAMLLGTWLHSWQVRRRRAKRSES